jgi:hypothetical protein
MLTVLETHLRPYFATDADWEIVKRQDMKAWRKERFDDLSAKFQVGKATVQDVAELLEAAVYEYVGFSPGENGAASEWRHLQVDGELPQGEQFLEVLKQGLPTTRELWLQTSSTASV